MAKKRYRVISVVTISCHTDVDAASPEEAREVAFSTASMQGLCHYCARADGDGQWATSGELDGEPSDDDKDVFVEELDS